MPAPGDQHLNYGGPTITSVFEEAKPRISEYTAQEIATLQSRLEKQLGPEYISSRPGPGGQKVHYITGEKCIQLANEVFGFNGWSSSIMNIQVDYVDEDPVTRKISLGLSVIVRVTLRDGTFHEDIGYGEMENCKGKGAAFHKAKKEGTTDALKRALRNFGNVLGNCIYDKAYLTKVMKVKVPPPRWDADALHRHSDNVGSNKEAEAPNIGGIKQGDSSDLKKSISDHSSTETLTSGLVVGDFLDDDFDDFDEADLGDSNHSDPHPDEVVLPVSMTSHHCKTGTSSYASPVLGGFHPSDHNHRLQMPASRTQIIPALARPSNENPGTEANAGRRGPQPLNQTNNTNSDFTMPSNGTSVGGQVRLLEETNTTPRSVRVAHQVHGRVLHQPSRTGPGPDSAPHSPSHQQKPLSSNVDDVPGNHAGRPAIESGFFSARAVTMLPEVRDADGLPPALPENLPAFNPHAESPSIRKTPGIDHNKTKPLTKELKHVPGSTHMGAAVSSSSMRTNIVNPQLDAMRRIGAPGSPSPMANRGMYRPPTMKRPHQAPNLIRPPLEDLPMNENIHITDDGGDTKRPRLNGP